MEREEAEAFAFPMGPGVEEAGRPAPVDWAHFKEENVSLFLEAAMLEELEEVIGRQIRYYNERRQHSRLGYRPPVEYLKSEGFISKTLAENEAESGSISGAMPLHCCPIP